MYRLPIDIGTAKACAVKMPTSTPIATSSSIESKLLLDSNVNLELFDGYYGTQPNSKI